MTLEHSEASPGGVHSGVDQLRADLDAKAFELDREGYSARIIKLADEINFLYEHGGDAERKIAGDTLGKLYEILVKYSPAFCDEVRREFCSDLHAILDQKGYPNGEEQEAFRAHLLGMEADQFEQYVEKLDYSKEIKRRFKQVDLMVTLAEGMASEMEKGDTWTMSAYRISNSADADSIAKRLHEFARGVRNTGRAQILENPDSPLSGCLKGSISFFRKPPEWADLGVAIDFKETRSDAELLAQTALVMEGLRSLRKIDAADDLALSQLGPYFDKEVEKQRAALGSTWYRGRDIHYKLKVYSQIRNIDAEAAKHGITVDQYRSFLDEVVVKAAVEKELLDRVRFVKPTGLPRSMEPLWAQYADMHGISSNPLDLSDRSLEWAEWAMIEGSTVLATSLTGIGAAKLGVSALRIFSKINAAQKIMAIPGLAAHGSKALALAIETGVSLTAYGSINLFRNYGEFKLKLASCEEWAGLAVITFMAEGAFHRMHLPPSLAAKTTQEVDALIKKVASGLSADKVHAQAMHSEHHEESGLSPEGQLFYEMAKNGYYEAALNFLKDGMRHGKYQGGTDEVIALFSDVIHGQEEAVEGHHS